MGDFNNVYYGVRYNEGVPSAQTGDKMIAELMAGEKNEFTKYFIVNRNLRYLGLKVLRSFFGTLKNDMENIAKNKEHLEKANESLYLIRKGSKITSNPFKFGHTSKHFEVFYVKPTNLRSIGIKC